MSEPYYTEIVFTAKDCNNLEHLKFLGYFYDKLAIMLLKN